MAGRPTPTNDAATGARIAFPQIRIDFSLLGIGNQELGIGVAPVGIAVSEPLRSFSSGFRPAGGLEQRPDLLAGHRTDIL